MVRSLEELTEIIERLKGEFNERLYSIVLNLNREEKLDEWLILAGLDDILEYEDEFIPYKTGKILILGESIIDARKICAILAQYGIDKSRVECCLEYDDVKSFNLSKLQYNPHYALIFVGPMPHKCVSSGNYSSPIARLEQERGFPPSIRLGQTGLKITKASLKQGIEVAIRDNLVAA